MSRSRARWVLLVALALFVHATRAVAQDVPVIDRPVVDIANVLRTSDADAISQTLVAHRESTGVQIAVLTLRTTQGVPIEDYALRVATQWGGGSKEHDDGVLLVLAVDDRRMRLEVGYGIEPVITDGVARGILDGARSHLQSGDYGGAVRKMVHEVVARTAHLKPGERARPPLGANVLFVYPGAMLIGIASGLLLWRRRGHWLGWSWLAAFLLVIGLTREAGFFVGYLPVFAVGLVGAAWAEKRREKKRFTITVGAFCTVAIFVVGAMLVGPSTLADDPEFILWLLAMHVAFVAVGVFMVKRRSTGGGGDWWSYTSSSSSSSWSSSSSSWSSSSSSWSSGSSSSSWSGGGGSFGGGGASSSW